MISHNGKQQEDTQINDKADKNIPPIHISAGRNMNTIWHYYTKKHHAMLNHVLNMF